MIVKLNNFEIIHAGTAGILRVINAIKTNTTETDGAEPEMIWQRAVEGCLSEYALAKYLNVHWAGRGKLGGVDVGNVDGCDCRSTPYKNGKLIIHNRDNDDRKFYLLTGIMGEYNIRGWIYARDAKKKKYWSELRKGRPAFNVPQSDLNKIE